MNSPQSMTKQHKGNSNRIIKFRAWDTKGKTMDYSPYGDEFMGEGTPINACLNGYPFDKDGGQILMQFTGLLDYNGREVFEGDLFGKMGGDVERPGEYEIHARVYFDEDMSAFCIDDNRGGWEYLSDYLDKLSNEREIIGNVWENPELINNSE